MSVINISAEPIVLEAEEDNSVNFVFPNGQEARYVDRDDYIIVYLSSHGGCNKACRMCHLTQTGQTQMVAATLEEMYRQAQVVLRHYSDLLLARQRSKCYTIHFNWMARGEPLENRELVECWADLTENLWTMAHGKGFTTIRFNISTIMPVPDLPLPSADCVLRERISRIARSQSHLRPTFFYSAYSAQPAFRKRWLPKAMKVTDALRILADMQRRYGLNVVMHHALIAGANDSVMDAIHLGTAVQTSGLKARFNLVRYNPYSPAQGAEPYDKKIEAYFDQFVKYMLVPGSRIVPRVGFSVAASCGCFINQIE